MFVFCTYKSFKAEKLKSARSYLKFKLLILGLNISEESIFYFVADCYFNSTLFNDFFKLKISA